MARWTVTGRFLARRAYWQAFSKSLESPTAAQARERVLSNIGGGHHVKRTLIRIESVVEALS